MKKLCSLTAFLSLAGAGALCAIDLPAFNVDAKVCFDTENVNRGRKEGQQNFKISTEAGVAILSGHGYVGVTSVLMLEDTFFDMKYRPGRIAGFVASGEGSLNSVSPYVGFCHDIAGLFTADLSLTHHSYPNLFLLSGGSGVAVESADKNGMEISAGIIGEVMFSPKLYLSYDFTREEFNTVLSASYTYDLGAVGLDRFAVRGNVLLGIDYAKKPYGIKNIFAESNGGGKESKDYFYYGLALDVTYTYNEQVSFFAGMRFSGNAADLSAWPNDVVGEKSHRDLFWFASAIEFSF